MSTNNENITSQVFGDLQYNAIQYNSTESMLPPTNDWWPRTVLV